MSDYKVKASRKGIKISDDARKQRKESRQYLANLGVNVSSKAAPYPDLLASANDNFFCVFCRTPCVIWRGKNPLFICKKCEWGGNRAKKCDFALLFAKSNEPIRITQVTGTEMFNENAREPSESDEEVQPPREEKKRKRKDGKEPAVRAASGKMRARKSKEEGGAVEATDELRDEENGSPDSHPACSDEVEDDAYDHDVWNDSPMSNQDDPLHNNADLVDGQQGMGEFHEFGESGEQELLQQSPEQEEEQEESMPADFSCILPPIQCLPTYTPPPRPPNPDGFSTDQDFVQLWNASSRSSGVPGHMAGRVEHQDLASFAWPQGVSSSAAQMVQQNNIREEDDYNNGFKIPEAPQSTKAAARKKAVKKPRKLTTAASARSSKQQQDQQAFQSSLQQQQQQHQYQLQQQLLQAEHFPDEQGHEQHEEAAATVSTPTATATDYGADQTLTAQSVQLLHKPSPPQHAHVPHNDLNPVDIPAVITLQMDEWSKPYLNKTIKRWFETTSGGGGGGAGGGGGGGGSSSLPSSNFNGGLAGPRGVERHGTVEALIGVAPNPSFLVRYPQAQNPHFQVRTTAAAADGGGGAADGDGGDGGGGGGGGGIMEECTEMISWREVRELVQCICKPELFHELNRVVTVIASEIGAENANNLFLYRRMHHSATNCEAGIEAAAIARADHTLGAVASAGAAGHAWSEWSLGTLIVAGRENKYRTLDDLDNDVMVLFSAAAARVQRRLAECTNIKSQVAHTPEQVAQVALAETSYNHFTMVSQKITLLHGYVMQIISGLDPTGFPSAPPGLLLAPHAAGMIAVNLAAAASSSQGKSPHHHAAGPPHTLDPLTHGGVTHELNTHQGGGSLPAGRSLVWDDAGNTADAGVTAAAAAAAAPALVASGAAASTDVPSGGMATTGHDGPPGSGSTTTSPVEMQDFMMATAKRAFTQQGQPECHGTVAMGHGAMPAGPKVVPEGGRSGKSSIIVHAGGERID